MDRFRVESLEKLINSNSLKKDQMVMTTETLIKKISIIVEGAKKRSNQAVLNRYLKKQNYWLGKLKE